ncbi:MAG: aldo/keto reductase [Lachnospiraceae bacterium]|nr:aldo/keto reductase [Lachnospiraceae bacterium]
MKYKRFKGLELSRLGFGAMRLPVIDGNENNIDRDAFERMVDYAMANGVNYFDTGWGYHGGNSEILLGQILSKYPRDSYFFADKFPGYDLTNMPKVREIFEKQLERTGLTYFDFYLLHNVCEMNIEQYMDPKYGIMDYLLEQKRAGRIRYLGLSSHAEPETLRRFLDVYGKEMEFCQLQLNYLDWRFQRGREKVEVLKDFKIPVWVMEPLRGGRLTRLDPDHAMRLHQVRPGESEASWAFRFLQTVPEVTLVLSGMSDEKQMEENVKIFSEERPLNGEERQVLSGIAKEMAKEDAVPCTACRYCTGHCPKGLDIPRIISLYNEHRLTVSGGLFGFIAPMALKALSPEKQPSACIHCRSCERVCPQGIKISEIMTDFTGILDQFKIG